jgi:hypothetical protein
MDIIEDTPESFISHCNAARHIMRERGLCIEYDKWDTGDLTKEWNDHFIEMGKIESEGEKDNLHIKAIDKLMYNYSNESMINISQGYRPLYGIDSMEGFYTFVYYYSHFTNDHHINIRVCKDGKSEYYEGTYDELKNITKETEIHFPEFDISI